MNWYVLVVGDFKFCQRISYILIHLCVVLFSIKIVYTSCHGGTSYFFRVSVVALSVLMKLTRKRNMNICFLEGYSYVLMNLMRN